MNKNKEKEVPSPPKRPLNIYFAFCMENKAHCDEFRKVRNIKGRADSKILRMEWRSLDENEKMKLKKEFDAKMVKYTKDLAKYEDEYGPIQKSEGSKKTKEVDEMEAKKEIKPKAGLTTTVRPKSPKPKK